MRFTASSGKYGRAMTLLLPVIALLLYAATAPGIARGPAAGVYVTAAALVERNAGAIDGWVDALAPRAGGAGRSASTYGPVAYAGGHYYYAAPPGPALLAAPVYAVGAVLAPVAGPLAPAWLVALLGPLAAALGVAGVGRLLARDDGQARHWPLVGAAAIAALWPFSAALTAPVVLAVLGIWLWPGLLAAWRTDVPAARTAVLLGLGLGALGLLDYAAGVVGVLLALTVGWSWRRHARAATSFVIALAAPLAILALYQTAAFGRPWGLAFRLAVDPAARSWLRLASPAVLALLVAPVLHLALRGRPGGWMHGRGIVVPGAVVLAGAAAMALRGPVATIVPLDWRAPAVQGAVALTALVALAGSTWARGASRRARGALVALGIVVLATAVPAVATSRPAGSATPTNYLAPFAIAASDGPRQLWTTTSNATADPGSPLRLVAGANATSPWIDAAPGTAYALTATANAPVTVIYRWEDETRQPVLQHAVRWTAGVRTATFAAPARAAGLRIEFGAGADPVEVGDAVLAVAAGVRVEPFPNYAQAALAFSYDWESAMGGLIHTRSTPSAGEGAGGSLGADGAPSIAEAEQRGLLMREGALYLAALFKQHDLRATYYATGYNLLDGNPSCERFLGNPTYENADQAHGWGSDYWRTHPWYSLDPCSTESAEPAWYFGAETRQLAAQGHEIGSHTFGHLYVRGVTPAELAADLDQWLRSARDIGLPTTPTFAFPWTSSNSLDARFWAVFEQLGIRVLTRFYQPLAHPFELDRVPGFPSLAIFPDQYLPSTTGAERAALGGIDDVLARRGYFSLWTHPDEVMRQDGPRIWADTIAYAASKRSSGLWISPVGEIAGYGMATRELQVTAVPVGGATQVVITNGSARRLDGVTLSVPDAVTTVELDGRVATDRRGNQVRLPALEPGAVTTVVVGR